MNNKRNARQKGKKVKVDMNPMVDLAFLLLTFFMMATTFSKPQAMQLVIPALSDNEEEEMSIPESKVLSILLDGEGKMNLYLGLTDPQVISETFDTSRLRALIENYSDQVENLMILIKPMDEAPYQHIVDALDELNQLGQTKYVIMNPEAIDLEILD